ncbi:MAG: PAS-domain containing protein [Alphaproteobacteria bacterium]|nr:PAS-domain containing protein [Alphaproteobacteria bacterium]MBU0797407.1 PAS-domain containing protein [Alphaproteobacteria bacterium]MBU0888527.1 PAS-domain containing protein [Alphaproteobacteria bacterium]MBU1813740.1 PAS-domain containing protein [Alphaproteobacteria bacterium]
MAGGVLSAAARPVLAQPAPSSASLPVPPDPLLIGIILLIALGGLLVGVLFLLRRARREVRETETQLRRTQESLAAAEDRLAGAAGRDAIAAAAETLTLPLWRRDSEGRIVWGNPAYRTLLTEAGAVAKGEAEPDLEIGGAGAPETGGELAHRALRSGHPQSASRHIVAGGRRRLMEFTETPLAGRTGTVGHLFDVSALERAQAELERHIAAQADVLENLQVAISIFGPDRRLRFFNATYASLWNLDSRFLATDPTIAEILEALRERRRLPEVTDFQAMKRALEKRFTSLLGPEEELLHLPDETTIRRVTTPHPFGGLVFADEDVTDRLAMERSYNTLNAVQRETIDKLHEGIAVFGGDARLKLWNPVFAQLWSLSAAQLEGEPHFSEIMQAMHGYFPPEEWPHFKAEAMARLSERETTGGRYLRADSTAVDYTFVPLPDGATLVSYVDVSDSVRVERALLERNEALEEADRLKSEFVANVSYELRTPLNAIVGFSEILAQGYFGPLNERQREYSQAILSSSQRLIELVNDILDLASIEAGYMTLAPEEMNVAEMMASLVVLSGEGARNHELQVLLDCPDDIGAIRADERRLKQALFNLISNAMKFTLPGGTITLSAQRPDAGHVTLTVSDNGVGIPIQEQNRVFGKFERGRNQREAGAGLGLSLVKSLVELHGGTVEMISDIDQGTTVHIHLPAGGPPQKTEGLPEAGSI